MTQNEHDYANCCLAKTACDVIFGRDVKTIEVFATANFEVASSCSYEIFKNDNFVTVKSAAQRWRERDSQPTGSS